MVLIHDILSKITTEYLIEKKNDWSLYFLNINGNVYLEGRYRRDYNGNWPNIRSSSTIPLNTWTHVAFSFLKDGGNQLRVYINGSLVGENNHSDGGFGLTSTTNIIIPANIIIEHP